MARSKTSPLEDLILATSKLPWWGGALLALGSYLVLHVIASRPITLVTAPGQMGDMVVKGMVTTLAMFGQYILPFAFGIAALVSGINLIKQKKLYEKVAASTDVAALNEMSWADFERLVAEYYQRNGFQVSRKGGNGPDGGIDLVLRKNNEKHLVQCKQWKAYKVGVQPVREFYGVMAANGAAGGYFVTSGVYTDDAKAFVKGLNIELVDGSKLKKMIDIAQKKTTASMNPIEVRQETTAPACPKCGMEMKKRTARQGSNAGTEFWGCSGFPKCNGSRPLEESQGVETTSATAQTTATLEPEKKNCPNCGTELVLRQFQSGPKNGQQFYGCIPCKKGWPVEQL
ncbi:restriction endonuclease [Citrifermentans bremense]|uniref:restriction endonuclease n=1 Tax=Citrifermentans bremense TaxID=60035 RepID=UPI0004798721|nr:restriction endonuclease [Citrifermentans bremense]